MKILLDIGHPGHLHYFRNAAKILENKGHQVFFTTRDKDVTLKLFQAYKIPYFLTGKNKSGMIKKAWAFIRTTFMVYRYARLVRPDIMVNFYLPFAGIAGKILKVPVIGFDDTEHAKFSNAISKNFTDVVLVPSSYLLVNHKNQLRFHGHMELCYVHPKYFRPDPSILKELDLDRGDKYVILRFISWSANHDLKASGLKFEEKIRLVDMLSKQFRVFISSEGELPDNLKKYQARIAPEKMHDALYYASLYIGEGATMASEAALMGTPSVYINSLDAGCLMEEAKSGLLYSFRDTVNFFPAIEKLLAEKNLKEQHELKSKTYLADNIDVTAFMVWFIENYPESNRIMQENPDYQYRFK